MIFRCRRARHQNIVVAGDPVALAEVQGSAAIEAAVGEKIDLFRIGLDGEIGGEDGAPDAVFPALAALVTHEQRQAVFEGKIDIFWVGLLFTQRSAECGQA